MKTLRTTHLEFGLRIKANTTAEVTLRLNQDTPAVDLVTTKISFTFKKNLEKIVLLILHALLLSVRLPKKWHYTNYRQKTKALDLDNYYVS